MRPFRNKEKINPLGAGEFESAAAQVTATEPTPEVSDTPPAEEVNEDRLAIREEWAEAVSRACFLPASKLFHPAYALTEEEANVLTPKMQVFLQAVADKYAPVLLARLTNKYPEFFDISSALAILYFQKWRYVAHIRAIEAQDRARKEAENKETERRTINMVPNAPVVATTLPKAEERLPGDTLVI